MDDIREIGAVGVETAASRLSDLTHRRCSARVLDVSWADAPEVVRRMARGNAFAVALSAGVSGDIPASAFVVFRRIHAQAIVKFITRAGLDPSGRELDFTSRYALRQLGETLTKAFTDAVHGLLRAKCLRALSDIIVGTWDGALEDALFKAGPPSRRHLVIHGVFQDGADAFDGHFVYLLPEESVRKLTARIRELLS